MDTWWALTFFFKLQHFWFQLSLCSMLPIHTKYSLIFQMRQPKIMSCHCIWLRVKLSGQWAVAATSGIWWLWSMLIIPKHTLPASHSPTHSVKGWNWNSECSPLWKGEKCETPEVTGLKHYCLMGDVLEFLILACRTSTKTWDRKTLN